MLAIFSRLAYPKPPGYRFRDRLTPASVADKIYNPSSTIDCNKLYSSHQADLCRERAGFLTQILERYRTQGNGLQEVIEVLECEIRREKSWYTQLIHATSRHDNKINRHSSNSNYQGLVNSAVTKINDIGQTSKGVFYVLYTRSGSRRECSFVSQKKLLLALGEIHSIDVQRVSLDSQKKSLTIRTDESEVLDVGATPANERLCRELPINQVVADLTCWNNSQYGVQSQRADQTTTDETTSDQAQTANQFIASSFQQARVRSEVWSALMDEGLTVFVAEEFGEVFFRVHRLQSFLGVISVDGEGTISIVSSALGSESKVVTSPVRAVESLKLAFSPVPPKTHPPTITLEDWEALKQIVKGGTDRQILTTEETLSIVLDPKYLRPCESGETPSPRMILCEHYLEIRRRLFDAVAIRQVSTLAHQYQNVWEYGEKEFDDNDRSELGRLRAVYPREASRLEQAYEVVKKYEGLKLGNIVVQPFSVCVFDANSRRLARLSINSFSHHWQIQQVVKGDFSNFADVESLESAIAALQHDSRHRIFSPALALFPG